MIPEKKCSSTKYAKRFFLKILRRQKMDSDTATEKTTPKSTPKNARKRKTARPARSGSPRQTRSSDFYTSMVEEAIRQSKLEEDLKKKGTLKTGTGGCV